MVARSAFSFLSVVLLGVVHSTAAKADAFHVANWGTDSTTCGAKATPCATLVGAHARLDPLYSTARIVCLDPVSNSGALFIISKPVEVDCRAGAATVGTLIINAPGSTVRLLGLNVNSYGFANEYAIEIRAASVVELREVRASYNLVGVMDRRSAAGNLLIKDSSMVSNGNGNIVIAPQGSVTIAVVLDNVSSTNSRYGIAVGAGGRVMIDRSTFFANNEAGIEADPGAVVDVQDTRVSNNNHGLQASPGSQMSVANSSISSNNVGVTGSVRSFGNNRLLQMSATARP